MSRDRVLAALRGLPYRALVAGARQRTGRAIAAARRRPDALLAAALVVGVAAMVLHWW